MATWQDYMEIRVKGQERPMPWYLHDKLKCYNFCERHGIPTAEVLRVFETPDQIDLVGLEGPFVLKPTLQSSMKGVMVLSADESGYYDELRDRRLSMDDILEEQTRYFEQTKAAGKKIIIEKKIDDADGHKIPLDYKAYAFNGEVSLMLVVDRNQTRSVVSWFDGDFKPIRDDRVQYKANFEHHREGQIPDNAEEMIAVASKASSLIETPFARIDMYSTTRGVIVGEITLVPGGLYYGNQYFLSDGQQELMGLHWEKALNELGRTEEIIPTSPSKRH